MQLSETIVLLSLKMKFQDPSPSFTHFSPAPLPVLPKGVSVNVGVHSCSMNGEAKNHVIAEI